MANSNPNSRAIESILTEYRSIKKRGRRVKHTPARSRGANRIKQWYKDRNIHMKDLR
jgi:hypothetical protein